MAVRVPDEPPENETQTGAREDDRDAHDPAGHVGGDHPGEQEDSDPDQREDRRVRPCHRVVVDGDAVRPSEPALGHQRGEREPDERCSRDDEEGTCEGRVGGNGHTRRWVATEHKRTVTFCRFAPR